MLIVSFLQIGDVHMLSMTSDGFWCDISDVMKRIRTIKSRNLNLFSSSDIRWSVLACTHIHTIDFTENSLVDTNTIKVLGSALRQCKQSNLRTVILDRCARVTDRQVNLLIDSGIPLLKRISVIQCDTGWPTILKAFENNIILNRVPSWFVGHWHCVHHDAMKDEVHTYYPDGTFSFSRDSQCSGYVPSLRAVCVGSNKVLDIKIRYYFLHLWMYSSSNTYPPVRVVKLDENDMRHVRSDIQKKYDDMKMKTKQNVMMMSAQVNTSRMRPSADVMLPINPKMIVPGANYSVGFWKRKIFSDSSNNATSMTPDLAVRFKNWVLN